MVKIKIGPSGLGPVNSAIETLRNYNQLGIKVCEIAFTYGVYIKDVDAIPIKKEAEKLGISLSIHAPYYVNLNSKEKKKVFMSKKRILDCCRIGHLLGVKNIVFHSGFYMGLSKEEAFVNIKNEIIDMQKTIKENKWDVRLCPEIMGKKNVFGSIDEIKRLVDECGCSFCIDFAHILARYGSFRFEEIKKAFLQKEWHCHFSGIEYSKDKGERNHKITTKDEWKNLFDNLKELDKDITIISESPNTVEDAVLGVGLVEKIKD